MIEENKIRVVMVCNLSDSDVRSHLPLVEKPRFNFARRILGIEQRKVGYGDIADWNRNIADYMDGRDDVEFWIISPHPGMKKMRVAFAEGKINFVFLNTNLAGIVKRFIRKKTYWRIINPFSIAVKREINKISPDLVVLMGAENPYYSSAVFGIKKYPLYVMCQTVYNNPERKSYGMWNHEKLETELDIFHEFHYFGVYSKLHYELVKQYSPDAYIFRFGYPQKEKLLNPIVSKKEFDFINFAYTMGAHKGFQDSIKAMAIVKKSHPYIKLNLVGRCSEKLRLELDSIIKKYELSDNISFTDFFEDKKDLFIHIQKSRFAVLPCKLDHISGTMSQAMQLGLPLVVYHTTGTPSFNRDKPCVLIAEKENVEELAQHMISLIERPELADMLSKNAREYQEWNYEKTSHNGEHIVENFRAIIENFRNGTSIPQEQLFNPDKDD